MNTKGKHLVSHSVSPVKRRLLNLLLHIRRRLKAICLGNREGRENKHAALGGAYQRNFATLNDELIMASSFFAYFSLTVLAYLLGDFFAG